MSIRVMVRPSDFRTTSNMLMKDALFLATWRALDFPSHIYIGEREVRMVEGGVVRRFLLPPHAQAHRQAALVGDHLTPIIFHLIEVFENGMGEEKSHVG